jgi:hypothetical protein
MAFPIDDGRDVVKKEVTIGDNDGYKRVAVM